MEINIEISYESDSWALVPEINEKKIAAVLVTVLGEYHNFQEVKNVDLSILLTDNKRMQSLNKDFRKKDNATNVLAFPDIEIDAGNILEFKPDLDYMYLGDIAFGYEKILAEAEEHEIGFIERFMHLLVHAILHLLGYDHDNAPEAEEMEYLEAKILKKLSIASPY